MSTENPCGGCTIPVSRLRELLEYDPLTGMFRWRNPRPRQAPGWFRGNKSVRNYRRLYIEGRHVMAHVVAWALMTGEWPDHRIDHRDRDQGNTEWSNLRAATQAENGCNRSINRNNKTGIKGVTRLGERYRATISKSGEKIHLGVFATLEEATRVRAQAEERYFGEFR